MSDTNFASDVTEFRLDNGLTVLLKENRNAPVINFNVVYRVGSKYERPGITGISHLLEHMMFKTSKNLPLGEFDRRLKAVGADNNAYTWLDQTVYYETIAADQIDVALALEAERMVNLACLEEDHRLEMTVVRNELEQREDSPYSLLYEELLAHAFMVHNYRIPTIGWVEDVESITTADIREYYRAFYQPANAFIVAVGDFEAAAMLEKIRAHFGGISGEPVRLPRLTAEPPQRGERRFELRRPGQVDFVMAGWHIPPSEHPDAFALVVLGNILGHGRTSRLYGALIDSGKCAMARAGSQAFGYADPFLFTAAAALNPGVPPAEAEELIYAEIKRIMLDGPTDEELARAKKQARVSFVFDKDSIESEANSILSFELLSGWRTIDDYLPGIERVSAGDVKRVAQTYLVKDNRTVGTYFAVKPPVPEFQAPPEIVEEPPVARYRPLAPGPAPRSAATAGGNSAAAVTTAQLENGLTVVIQENHNNATVSIHGLVRAGKIDDPPGRPGLASLVVSMLPNGTERHTKLELATIKENAGIELGFGASREYFSLSGRSLTEDFGLMLDLLAEQLLAPAFPAAELEKTRQQVLAGLLHSEDDTFESAFVRGRDLIYGAGHPFAGRVEGTQQSVAEIGRDDLVGWYESNVKPGGAILTIIGDVDTAAALALVRERLGGWKGAGRERDGLLAASAEFRESAGRRELLEIPGKSNVSLLWAAPGPSKARDDWAALSLMNFIFGGDFYSRINERLRVKDGLTYGSFSWFSNGLGHGPYCVSAQVNPGSVQQAIDATTEELSRFAASGVEAGELAQAKSYLTGNFAVKLSTNGAIASVLTDAMYLGRGPGFIREYRDRINAVSAAEVNELARTYADPARMLTVIAGDIGRTGLGAGGSQ